MEVRSRKMIFGMGEGEIECRSLVGFSFSPDRDVEMYGETRLRAKEVIYIAAQFLFSGYTVST